MSTSVLLVEDNPFVLHLVAERLRAMGLEPVCAADGRDASRRALNGQFSLIITDLDLSAPNGRAWFAAMRASQVETPILALTSDETTLSDCARRFGVEHLLVKPFSMQQLEVVVRDLLQRATTVGQCPPPDLYVLTTLHRPDAEPANGSAPK